MSPVLFDASIATFLWGLYPRRKLYYWIPNTAYITGETINSSRLLTDEKTSYAKLPYRVFCYDHTKIIFNQLALRAYGCRLPIVTDNKRT